MTDPSIPVTEASGSGPSVLEETLIAGYPVVTASRADLVKAMIHDCRLARISGSTRPRLVFDLNGHGISTSRTDPAFGRALAQADLIHADGGIWVALSRFTGKPIAERSATTDMMTDFAAACEREGLSFYILGGTEEVNLAFVRFLAEQYPKLRVAGRWNGYFGADLEDAVIAAIGAAAPDVLWVGMGKPREQLFSLKLRDRVRIGWLVTCGGCFNYFVGGYKRAPIWMQRSNLEWLHRMATEPSKFAWRYLTTNPHSLVLALVGLVRQR